MESPKPIRCANHDCKNQASLRCVKCKDIWYCSVDCQKEDWRFHKLLCKLFVSSPPSIGPYFRRVITLSEGRRRPIFTWMPVTLRAGDAEDDTSGPTISNATKVDGKHFVAIHHDAEIAGLDGIKVPAGKLPVTNVLVHDSRKEPGARLNECLSDVFGEELPAPFFGEVVIVAHVKVGGELFVADIDTRHFTSPLLAFVKSLKE